MKAKWDNLGCVLAIIACIFGFIIWMYIQNKQNLEEDKLFYDNCNEWHRDWAGDLVCDKFRE